MRRFYIGILKDTVCQHQSSEGSLTFRDPDKKRTSLFYLTAQDLGGKGADPSAYAFRVSLFYTHFVLVPNLRE